ncbi:MAG: methylaspartate mutase subunit E [Eubacteriales bacterium]|nr:methylaspartate mutase subunit E [Christensenellaceae bacterium]MDD6361171.1 methylaspartate mutase subunit E [Christensenellaceae bacterium]MDD7092828.1 methylaspartate mutase subunit E [Christensenellaceae bacterium]MDY3241013.1 methylaspartate mutase subunit E [Eubacteriales bacterium]MDY6078382.1 methylaspartate mutase subunit E [Eubacteriales bacterium]
MIRNKKLTEEEFLAERKEVLASWKTGNDPQLNFDEAIKYLQSVPPEKNFAVKLAKAKEEGSRTLVQPRAGVPVIEKHIELLQYLEKSGADFLPSTIDSYTRQNRYNEAEEGIKESEKAGRALLNGFPAVNHGVTGCKKILESVNVPLQARHGTPDSRLLAEVVAAAGWTSNEGGGISYNIPYAKSVSVEDSLKYWQYCDRLVGYYEEHGVHINREPFGPLTGTLVPPSISNTVGIIEALLAAEQGVKNITVGYGMGGNIVQDVAAIRSLQKQTDAYLKKFGYNDVTVTTVFHQWMGGFPQDEAEAVGLIAMSSTFAALSGATKMITKTPHESVGVPTKEANGIGIKASKIVVKLLAEQKFPDCEALRNEMAQIEKEVDCLMEATLNLGDGDLAVGTVKAFEQGIIDIPFAPSKFNAGLILPARDNDGCIRILEFGHLGFSDEIKAFHKKKIEERAAAENREVSFQLTIDDIYAVSTGHIVGRPSYKD